MSTFYLSLILGLTAALANIAGGAVVAHRRWEQRYLKYFVALGAGFMLGTALAEMVPESVQLRGHSAGVLDRPSLSFWRRDSRQRIHCRPYQLFGAAGASGTHLF
jgi:hypothetical protein